MILQTDKPSPQRIPVPDHTALRRWKATFVFSNSECAGFLPNFELAVNPSTIMSIIALRAYL